MIATLLFRLLRWLGPLRVATVGLLGVAVGAVAVGLTDTVRGLERQVGLEIALAGLFVGWGVAERGVRGRWAALVALLAGAGVVALRVGRLGGPLVALLVPLLDTALRGAWLTEGAALREPWGVLGASTGALLFRLHGWGAAILTGSPAFDPLVAGIAWMLALWLVAAWAGWIVCRRAAPLPALLPAASLLAGTLAWGGAEMATLLVLLGAGLLLVVVVGQTTREAHWQAEGLDYPSDLTMEILAVGVTLAMGLLLVAGIAPSFSLGQVARVAQRLFLSPVQESAPFIASLGLEPRPPAADPFETVRSPGLPRLHLLGSGPELSEQVVLRVTVQDIAPEAPAPRFYWRTQSYDRYSGYGWLTSATRSITYEAHQPLPPAPPAAQRLFSLEVERVESRDPLLVTAGTPLSVSAGLVAAFRPADDLFGATLEPRRYEMAVAVPAASVAQLRGAGTGYPEWVRARYLALPERLPARVATLALDLTATAATPYNRALALENYLRRFPYTLELPVPPADRDMADYFLFDLQRGYCDYYATAMVVLARAAGLPARLAVGYSSGQYDAATGRFLVTEADAHSWPEVYFPNYGWVPFEPTGSQPRLTGAALPPPTPALVPTARPVPLIATPRGALFSVGLAILVGAGMVFGSSLYADEAGLRRASPPQLTRIVYRRLTEHGARLGVEARTGRTPHEFALALTARLHALDAGRWAVLLAPSPEEIHLLTEAYIALAYAPPSEPPSLLLLATWKRLRLRLWLAWLLTRLRR